MDDLPIWDSVLKKLKGGNQLSKARKFNKLKLIVPRNDGYKVLPIPNYNKTTYKIDINNQCNCQYNVKTGNYCSHILAVSLYKKQREENNDK
tara:strand:+ start:4855 stop:5130 length:276 start_codon:yes stop_codon:yes gene_type:complete